jgi:hypothetical protein
MAEIVNLRQARKRKRRSDKEEATAGNRLTHGRAAAEKTATRLIRDLEDRRVEGHRREVRSEADPEDGA